MAMRIVIEQSDFRRLSAETQKELMEAFAGKALVAAPSMKKQGKLLWRQPMDLSPDLAVRLLHGLSEPHRARLRLFAQKGGRVTQRELLRATGDEDLRALSHFQAVLSRRLRRLLDDPEKRDQVGQDPHRHHQRRLLRHGGNDADASGLFRDRAEEGRFQKRAGQTLEPHRSGWNRLRRSNRANKAAPTP
jgi:hypothetical protein